jgi:DNA-binding NtrC family response regulator
LDEIGDMSPNLQVKLLRVLQEQKFERVGAARTLEVDVRIIAATNANLTNAVNKAKFRQDLFYRLNVIPMKVPPLRHRKPDIPLLIDFFVEKFNREKGKQIVGFAKGAMDALLEYDWPGNVRELENLVERVVILANGEKIAIDDLPGSIKEKAKTLEGVKATVPKSGFVFDQAVEEYEKQLILQALNETNWVKTKAAKLLNINRTTLIEKMKKKNLHKKPAVAS